MATTRQSEFPFPAKRRYRGANIPMRVIRRYGRAIGEHFQPDKVILFGSYAYGTPHEDSDVDILVIMATRNKHGQRVKIRMALTAPFPMDLLVRTPKEMKWRLEEGDLFHTEIVSKGKVLYEKADPRMGEKPNTITGPPSNSAGKSRRCMTWCASTVSSAPKSTSRLSLKNSGSRCRRHTTWMTFLTSFFTTTRRCARSAAGC
jgi:predicted nucleotidyltransferase